MLRVGEWFDFSSLRIIVVDADGHTLAPVPVRVEVEEVYPPLFSLSNDIIGYGGRNSDPGRSLQVPRSNDLPWNVG